MNSPQYDYIYITISPYGGYSVKGVDKFPDHSVLAGQPRKNFIESYPTLEEAQEAYPDATISHPLLEPQNTFDHLPDDEDY